MNFLITGISSYIATYAAKKILNKGHQVVGVSRTTPNLIHPAFKWIEYDLSKKLLKLDIPIDFIVHMAAVARLDKTATDYFESNILLTNNIKKLALMIHPKAVFYTSSMKVYGEISCKVADEQMPIINPDLYGMSKYFGEKLLEQAMPAISIRMPGTIADGSYGWIDSVYQQLKKNKPVTLKNSSYNHVVHANDIVSFILKTIKLNQFQTNQFNICASGLSTSLKVVQMMKDYLSSTSEITWSDEDNFHIISNKKISKLFQPMSVRKTIQLYLDEMKSSHQIK
ncbi:MAG: NAD(P)-dependent oxidoreductase [Desulfobacula sp.]|uniref:NAD-dependent epimerase/dehydratase family protein n=1 Tax=Desulfobacula sp. TaxID=2593537 RepID=UPI0025BF133B|nr:NAD(P)-dependent oxidoreductase [Desulfobacula sp.]MCD4722135.1 NAD(P)-dependent oxidoreductase [Desulfobacula sp.]